MNSSGFSIIRWQSRVALGRAFLSEATTSGPIVIFGTKCPSITSQWSTVPPPSSAAFASSPSRAKFAESIDGASSMVMGPGPLLPTSEKRDYTRKFFVLLKSDIRTKFRTSPRNRAAFRAALPCQLDNSHDIQRIFGSHRWHDAPQNGVSNVRVVIAIIASGRGNAPLYERTSFGNRENAPIFFGLISPGLVARKYPLRRFLSCGAESWFQKLPKVADHNKPGPRPAARDPERK